MSELELKNQILENKLINCKMRFELFLNKVKINNIMLFKVQDSTTEIENLLETTIQIFVKAEVTCDNGNIVSVKRIGNTIGARPILVTFDNKEIKDNIFSMMKNFGKMNIGVLNDLSKVLRENKNEQYSKLLECKLFLEHQGKSVQIKGHHIIMDNKRFDLNMILNYLHNLCSNALGYDDDPFDEETNQSLVNTDRRKRSRSTGAKNTVGRKAKNLKYNAKNGTLKIS